MWASERSPAAESDIVGGSRADVHHPSEEQAPMSKNQHSNKEAKKQPQTTFKEKRAAKKAKYDVKAIIPPSPPRGRA
jgi:hypothetical protein